MGDLKGDELEEAAHGGHEIEAVENVVREVRVLVPPEPERHRADHNLSAK